MNQTAEVLEFNKERSELSYDDIKSILNPVQAADLVRILLLTPEDRRLNIALVFSDITTEDLFIKSGLGMEISGSSYFTFKRWMRHECKLPLGAAFRLAKVFDVPVEILFRSNKWKSGSIDYSKKEKK